MNITKTCVLITIYFSVAFPYSNYCGSPLITTFTTNSIKQFQTLYRSGDIGSISIFLVRNLSTNELEEIEFELLMTDSLSKFYGEVSEIATGNINLSTVEELFHTFTSSTLDADSLNLQNGIRSAEETMLGSPPTINNDVIVNILLMDIRDGYFNSGEFVAGFFDPQDQFLCMNQNGLNWQPEANENTCSYPYSWTSNGNGENIIYIDSNPSIIDGDGLENALFTLAHEYQHLLHWNADIREGYFGSTGTGWTFHNPWINEGISDLMPSILGLGIRDYSSFFDNPTIGLDEWSEIGSSSTLPYYAKSALFFQYLYELEGLYLVGDVFGSSNQGLISIKELYDEKGFESLYINWIQSIVIGKLEVTELNKELYSEYIGNYISIGLQSTLIETGKAMPGYSFALFSVPDYLSTVSVNTNLELNISLLYENVFFASEDIVHSGGNNVEKIIVYTKNVKIDNIIFDISYRHLSSPSNNNLFIFPNPITGSILSYIYFGDESVNGIILELFDLNGRNVLSTHLLVDNLGNYSGNMKLNISSGTYLLKSTPDSGSSETIIITLIK